MALNDRLHFVPHFLPVRLGLFAPMVEEDCEKAGEGRGSIRTLTYPGATSPPGTSVAEHWRDVSVDLEPDSAATRTGFSDEVLGPFVYLYQVGQQPESQAQPIRDVNLIFTTVRVRNPAVRCNYEASDHRYRQLIVHQCPGPDLIIVRKVH